MGGVSIFIGFVFGVLLLDVPLSGFRALFLASGVLVLIGVLDDVHELSSSSRFVAQIIAALIMIYYGNIYLLSLGELVTSDELFLGSYAVPLTIFATVGVVNAMNMTDGMDGLAGSLFLVVFGALAWYCYQAGFQCEKPSNEDQEDQRQILSPTRMQQQMMEMGAVRMKRRAPHQPPSQHHRYGVG